MRRAYATALEGSVEEKEAFVRAAHDRGVTLFNSANIYTGGPHGSNEELLGRALKGRDRSSFCITTKFGIKLPEFKPDLKAESIRGHCEAALSRLQMDYIDLFIVCRQDPATPIEETMMALKELVKEGKIKAIGLSEASSLQIRRAHAVHPICAVEMEYSLFSRGIEADILPTCRELGICVLAYSPIGRGFLTGKISSVDDLPSSGPFMGKDFRAVSPRFAPGAFDANKMLVDRITALATAKGVTTTQLALAWVHSKGADIFPIPGTTKLANLEENLGALLVHLTPEEQDHLESAVNPAQVVGMRYGEHAMAACHENMPTV